MPPKISKSKKRKLDENLADLDISRDDNDGLHYLYPKDSLGALAYSTTPGSSNKHYVN